MNSDQQQQPKEQLKEQEHQQPVEAATGATLRSELAIQHLGILPVHVIDDIYNSINVLIYTATKSLEEYIVGELGPSADVDRGIHQIETLLEKIVDECFDRFEVYVLRNIFNLPPPSKVSLEKLVEVSLESLRPITTSNQYGEEEIMLPPKIRLSDYSDELMTREATIDEEMAGIRAQIRAYQGIQRAIDRQLDRAMKRRDALKVVHGRAQMVKTLLESPAAVLKDASSISGDLRTNIMYVCDQVERIRQQIDGLNKDLQDKSVVTKLQTPSERTLYIQKSAEAQLSRYLESVSIH
ncbi:hypothetical protein GQ42DRAFT_155058 [Ramicandelaber brevisporus]|nr:hypothetical protein GQ42DRAFT_155058 [Ramicandelaber brevisporus]